MKSINEDEKRKVKRSCTVPVRVVLNLQYEANSQKSHEDAECRMKHLEQIKKRIRNEKKLKENTWNIAIRRSIKIKIKNTDKGKEF